MDRTQFTKIFTRYYMRSTSLGIIFTLFACAIRGVNLVVYLPYVLSASICFTYLWASRTFTLEQKHQSVVIALILGYTLTFYLYFFLGGHFLFSSLVTINLLLTMVEFGVFWSFFTYALSMTFCFYIDLITAGNDPFKLHALKEFFIQSTFLFLFNLFIYKGLRSIECYWHGIWQTQYEQVEKLERLLEIDELTGCYSRFKGNQLIEQQIQRAQPFTLLYIDLDGFKAVNDEFGHDAGDKVLQITAQRILHLLDDGQFATRIGGDEFILCLPNIEDTKELEQFQSLLHHAFSAPIFIHFQNVHIGLSVGMARFPHEGSCSDSLIQHADQMMYLTKRSRT
ncbi:TPA: diguanylate cyclase [Vibrio parahaemolyticus]|uniref:GGDEF domain-containing protein n=2 Tax=Vibrio TaxID=662 RepID=UPI000812CCC9|nr:GGDEF domain-containing protein [Vibrio parahaemolyticus]EHK0840938.1 GGDEF domain-containing protein [Vibrio parahaemolyticus]EII3139468.1 GGDEF domain-containing protein [Vibrio parahaemolyticus]EJB8406292.1 GGDEF domain-containing protein [Vibrio parahaemolyticus]EJB8531806.1 GGDEF domain-containing protein [Vibrio parahaemolyticus]EJE4186631.1 GGDEF domain-containing protein [Vibrio parahaemolyticus]